MRKIYTLAIGLVGLVGASFAQNNLDYKIEPQQMTGEVIATRDAASADVARGTQSCVDTVDYALYRSLNSAGQVTYATVLLQDSMTTIKGMGLFFPVPAGQSVGVNGLEFFANSRKADGSASSVVVSLYTAGADSLPTGTALETQTVSVDTNSQTLGDIYNLVTFSSVANLSNSFVITVEAGSPTDSTALWTGGVLSGGFDGYPTSLEVGGNWLRPGASAQIGGIVPRIHPLIQYDVMNNVIPSVTKLSGPNEEVTFNITASQMGSSYLTFTGLLQDNNTTAINFGDGNMTVDASATETNTYAVETNDYTVVLTDSVGLYTINPEFCVATETITIQKAYPLSINDLDSGKFFAFTSNDEIVVGNGEGTAVLYSITGTVVKQVVLSNTLERINVSDLSNGVYMLQVGENVVKLNL
ncbi:T9SS type A sorting domain-containing protein [bacterium SCSIO 12643]|nr:T9SS type A sorting domain-containing protein [bacterium SCSIO 12643]